MKEEYNASPRILLRNYAFIVGRLPIHPRLVRNFLGNLSQVESIDGTSFNRHLNQMNRFVGFDGIDTGNLRSQLSRFLFGSVPTVFAAASRTIPHVEATTFRAGNGVGHSRVPSQRDRCSRESRNLPANQYQQSHTACQATGWWLHLKPLSHSA